MSGDLYDELLKGDIAARLRSPMTAKWSPFEMSRIRRASYGWPTKHPIGRKVQCPVCGKGYGWAAGPWTARHLPCFPELHDREVEAR